MNYWRGVLLGLLGVVATLWLAATGQLSLYIHPRYLVFTVIVVSIGGVMLLLAFRWGGEAHDDHGHEHAEHTDHPKPRAKWMGAASIVLVAATALVLLVLPPSTLSSLTATQRASDTTNLVTSTELDVSLAQVDTSNFSVKDWANLLRQGAGLGYLSGKTATMSGFITPDSHDPSNVFDVTRLVITCCAVDAQPLGVPVYFPGWQDQFQANQWVQVTGSFISGAGTQSTAAILLSPTSVDPIAEPANPYVY